LGNNGTNRKYLQLQNRRKETGAKAHVQNFSFYVNSLNTHKFNNKRR
jgi:hypothetical protein